MATIQARDITAVMRTLLPQVQPLRTSTRLSGEGMVLGYEITLPMVAAYHHLAGGGAILRADATWLDSYLSRHLGREVHVAETYRTRRRDYSTLAHLMIKTGPRED